MSKREALQTQPRYCDRLIEMALTAHQAGQLDQAIETYQAILKLHPDDSTATRTLLSLGQIYLQQNRAAEAIQAYQQMLRLEPNNVDVYLALTDIFHQQNQVDEALQACQQALQIEPDDDRARIALCLNHIPIIHANQEEIQIRRAQYEQHLVQLVDFYQTADAKTRIRAAEAVGASKTFFLSYQGLCDRELQQLYGALIHGLMVSRYPQWGEPLPLPRLEPQQKVRIGFVGGYFRDHSVWKIPLKGWVENLDRSEFELFGYYTGSVQDAETVKAAKIFDKFLHAPIGTQQWAEAIAQDKLHVLIFPEIGMDTLTIQLACLRLAPIQMTSLGHPETTGLPTMDYYLSSDLMESEEAQNHYTEKLIRLPNLSIYYTPKFNSPEIIDRHDLDIHDRNVLFWCCQSLFKYLPQHDDVFPKIAIELTNARFVFINYYNDAGTNLFRQRLHQAFQEYGLNYEDYCRFVPRMNSQCFAGIAAIADVFLDSIGWSGFNSALESIAQNLPIVTLPGDLMRGRHSFAILKMLGMEETIATSKEDYVRLAVHLGQDSQYRRSLSQQIKERKQRLYGDMAPVKALEDVLLQLFEKPKRDGAPEIAEALRLALQHQRNHQFNDAEQIYLQMLEHHPNHPEALLGLGMLVQRRGDGQAAEQLLMAAVQVQPDSVQAWFSLGNLYQSEGKLSQAAEAYCQATTLRPDAAPIYNNLGYTLQQLDQWEEAVICYQKAVALQPGAAEIEVNLANALQVLGQLTPEQQAHYATLNSRLAMNRRNAGDLKTAQTYYEQAIALQPDWWEAHYNLAVTLLQQGVLEAAILPCQKALELKPDAEEAQQCLQQIRQQQAI